MQLFCRLCSQETGESLEEIEVAADQHGFGVCVDACEWCWSGQMHAAEVCKNIQPGQPLPDAVQRFNEYHAEKGRADYVQAD